MDGRCTSVANGCQALQPGSQSPGSSEAVLQAQLDLAQVTLARQAIPTGQQRRHDPHRLSQVQQEPSSACLPHALDDDIGTGSQFLFTFVARNAANRALLQRYARLRLAAIVVHDDARHKWRLLQRRDVEQVMAIEGQQLTCVDFAPERQALMAALSSLDWRRAGLVAAGRDFPVVAHPLLSPEERQQLRAFLQRQQEAEGAGTTEFRLGHHSFFYGAPNALARVLLPLFKRIEDFSVYPRESQVGLPADLLDYDIDNPEPVTLHYPRQ